MAHHGSIPSEILSRLFDIGATGSYPEGKLGDDDEGEIKIAIAADKTANIVRLEFGKPVAWIGLTGEQAQSIADLLTQKAWELRGIR